MKTLNMSLVLSAIGIVAMLSSPAFAQKSQRVSHVVTQSSTYNTIPGYDRDGGTVAIPDPDQR
jgi:hypothetical protein